MVSSSLLAAVAVAVQAGTASAAFCDASFTATSVCLAEIAASSGVSFRIGVQEAAAGSTSDTLLQIVSPIANGWAGIAWGGSMLGNPLTVGWPSATDNSAIVSSRWTTSHTVPAAYAGATYRTLSSSKNATHWSLAVVCSGCSAWSGGSLGSKLAWASSTTAVATPASNTSIFGYHSSKGILSVDLASAKLPTDVFAQYVAFLSGGDAAPAPPSSAPAPPSPPSTTIAPPASSPAAPPSSSPASPPPPPVSSTHPNPSTSEAPPPPASSETGGSVTTVVSTVFVTVTGPGSKPAPSTTTSHLPGTIIPPWDRTTTTTTTPAKPSTTDGGDGGDGGDDDNNGPTTTYSVVEPTITVTVIEGGTVPSGAPAPPINHPNPTIVPAPIIVGGKKKVPPFVPPFRRPPPFGVPGWA